MCEQRLIKWIFIVPYWLKFCSIKSNLRVWGAFLTTDLEKLLSNNCWRRYLEKNYFGALQCSIVNFMWGNVCFGWLITLSVSICPLLHWLKFCCISLRGVTKTHTPKTQTSDPPKLYSFFTNKHGESVLFSTISAMYFSLALTVLRILVNS